MSERVIMYTDGGSRNNPGQAAIGVFVESLDKKFAECIGIKTNNEAEYQALITGLKKLKSMLGGERAKKILVECRLDSELVVKQLKHEYKIKEKKMQELFVEVWNMMLDFAAVEFVHVPREQNTVADALVNEVLDEQEKQASLI